MNGQTSATSPVVSGVPQGSVLRPLLFLIYINDIANVELSDSSLLLYADDVLLYRPIHCPGDYTYLQQNINALHTWSEANLLQFNPSKCRYMVVSRKVTPVLPDSDLGIDGSSLVKVDHYKYLGVGSHITCHGLNILKKHAKVQQSKLVLYTGNFIAIHRKIP